jgi:hypothetical protein
MQQFSVVVVASFKVLLETLLTNAASAVEGMVVLGGGNIPSWGRSTAVPLEST